MRRLIKLTLLIALAYLLAGLVYAACRPLLLLWFILILSMGASQ
jgi:hypothetical protein